MKGGNPPAMLFSPPAAEAGEVPLPESLPPPAAAHLSSYCLMRTIWKKSSARGHWSEARVRAMPFDILSRKTLSSRHRPGSSKVREEHEAVPPICPPVLYDKTFPG